MRPKGCVLVRYYEKNDLGKMKCEPLMKEVAIGINNVWLAQFVLNKFHYARQLSLARVLPVTYGGHGRDFVNLHKAFKMKK